MSGKAITLRSTATANPAVVTSTIIDGNNIGSVITCDSGEDSNTVIDGFTIRRFNAAGVGVTKCNNSTVKNCFIHTMLDGDGTTGSNTGCVIGMSTGVWCENIVIQSNILSPGNGHGGGIWSYSASGWIIEYNEFYNAGAALIYEKGRARNNHYRYNYFHGDTMGLHLGSGGTDGHRDDRVYGNLFEGIDDAVYSGFGGEEASGHHVYNNTFYNCDTALHFLRVGTAVMSGWRFYNNVVVNATGSAIVQNTLSIGEGNDLWSDYNCYWPVGMPSWSVMDNNSISADPVFVAAGSDFDLQSGSPCIGTGLDGADMGAYPSDGGPIVPDPDPDMDPDPDVDPEPDPVVDSEPDPNDDDVPETSLYLTRLVLRPNVAQAGEAVQLRFPILSGVSGDALDVSVYSVNGQLALEEPEVQEVIDGDGIVGEASIDTKGLKVGLYFVSATVNGYVQTGALAVK